MITVICGEDVVTSRQHYVALEEDYRKKQFRVKYLTPDQMIEVNLWLGESATLFGESQVFFTQDISRKLRKTDKRRVLDLERLSTNRDIEIVDWESVSARDLKIAKLGKVIEFKPKESIFKMTDSFYPSNLKSFLLLLGGVYTGKNEQFIFIMLIRHVRLLVLAKENSLPAKIPVWQKDKLQSIVARFSRENLLLLYESLFKIEVAGKTSATPFNLKESLDILACHFL